jgi:hypothetical protein
MKKKLKKLQLNRETLNRLSLTQAYGGTDVAPVAGEDAKALSIKPCTWIVSDCKYCTTPIDGCPDPTVA